MTTVLVILVIWFIGGMINAYLLARYRLPEALGLVPVWPVILAIVIVIAPFILAYKLGEKLK